VPVGAIVGAIVGVADIVGRADMVGAGIIVTGGAGGAVKRPAAHSRPCVRPAGPV
jgi:hypothetical protein